MNWNPLFIWIRVVVWCHETFIEFIAFGFLGHNFPVHILAYCVPSVPYLIAQIIGGAAPIVTALNWYK